MSSNEWDWSTTSFDFLDSVKQDLQAILVAMAPHEEDKLTWKESEHGIFNLGLAYKLATNQDFVSLLGVSGYGSLRYFLGFNPFYGSVIMIALG